MRKTTEILRLKWQHGRSHRQIAAALAVGDGTPSEVLARAKAAGIATWAEVDALTDDELDARLYPATSNAAARPLPDPAYLHLELRRKHVTLRLLHEPTHADAICDRLLHNAHRLVLKGPSKRNPKEEKSDH